MVDCIGCQFEYYESDTNFRDCKHPDFDMENPDKCPGYYGEESARADAKYGGCDHY